MTYLAGKQKEIDDLSTIETKARKATALWEAKSGAQFIQIKIKLKDMCIDVEICVYCENNEATDVEHIYPKKMYPERAFQWGNYLLACNKCNSHHKSDKFHIFNPQGSAIVENVTPPRGTYIQPANADALFINQREEDPNEFLELNLPTGLFSERALEPSRDYFRANFTKETLGLNRPQLVSSRKKALRTFVDRLKYYVRAKAASNFIELKDAVEDDFNSIDATANFDDEKARILESIKRSIQENAHPTVWKELIRQRGNLPNTGALFNAAPEAITW